MTKQMMKLYCSNNKKPRIVLSLGQLTLQERICKCKHHLFDFWRQMMYSIQLLPWKIHMLMNKTLWKEMHTLPTRTPKRLVIQIQICQHYENTSYIWGTNNIKFKCPHLHASIFYNNRNQKETTWARYLKLKSNAFEKKNGSLLLSKNIRLIT